MVAGMMLETVEMRGKQMSVPARLAASVLTGLELRASRKELMLWVWAGLVLPQAAEVLR